MKILYVARHGQNNADDEGSVAHALRELGHSVHCLQESEAEVKAGRLSRGADLLLFHKWYAPSALASVGCPAAFWYWDLVDHPDPLLHRRCAARVHWMRVMGAAADFGFVTDGDWAGAWNRGRHEGQPALRVLRQGADGRIAGRHPEPVEQDIDVLFCGIGKGGGSARESFVSDLFQRYGARFVHVQAGVYRDRLRELVARAKVVVAPDSPVTDRYWSNRVYQMLGFGAFLLHPSCAGLYEDYYAGYHLEVYHDRTEMFGLIDECLARPIHSRNQVAEAGLDRTLWQCLYLHRCQDLIRHVEGKP